MTRRSVGRRPGRTAVFGVLAIAGLVGLVASAQPWWRIQIDGADVVFSGSDVTGGLSQALPVVLLAGTLLALTVQVRGRQVLAVLLGLAAVGMVVLGGLRPRPSEEAVRTRVRLVTLADRFDLIITAWPWICLVGGVLGVAGSVLLGWSAGSWPLRPSRFELAGSGVESEAGGVKVAGATPSSPAGGGAAGTGIDPSEDPAAAWRALDAGIDPTADHHEDSATLAIAREDDSPGPDPDVRGSSSGDTMSSGEVFTGTAGSADSVPNRRADDYESHMSRTGRNEEP